ncbi:B12-binding domain-containing radical SAM protein [Thiohalomonas denitrificans]|uniref:Anaerobic magnesium-protoporphyrin IX monomethyl ester cyclase n=1 Tax=Thiohalomonas denitrificans TaxID=415747 RepID=A0A1G5QQQ7_9GAMM|nr:radical SAM protein [Thiohalomonas denitrificans]SCZ64224.1 anaerobic magnesium-protoporphyrin IX monomethyl ester cyclase [Thiohalomonas denitrificans]
MSANPPIALITLHAGFHHSSLALRSIAACCRDEPFYTDIRLFESTVKADPNQVIDEIAASAPRLAGFSTYLWNIDLCLALAEALKARSPNTSIVFGGPEAGPRGEELLATRPAVDFIIEGEGEFAFRDLARVLLRNEGRLDAVSGLLWREENRMRRNPIRPVPPEELISPYTEGLLDADKPLIYWETSRGCPFRCSFCTSAGDQLRTLPDSRIEAELEVLGRLEHKTVKLLDRSFHLGAKRTLRLLKRFLDTPDSLRFHLELNPDRITPEAMALFESAPPGKFQFEIGLQTLDDGVLDRIERRMDVPKGTENIRQLVAMNRHPVHLDLIVGLPDEDAEQCRTSMDRVFNLGADHLQLGTLKLLPGTALRHQASQYDYRFDPDPPYEVHSHRSLGADALNRFKHYAELIERLWNSGLLRHTLTWWVPTHFHHRVSRLLDVLLEIAPDLAHRPPPHRMFNAVATLLEPHAGKDPVLRQLFAWDYGHFALPGRQAPAVVHEAITWHAVDVGGRRKHRPVYTLGERACEVVNKRRREPLASGRYALWPRKHLKGRPATRIRIQDTCPRVAKGSKM